MLARPLTVLIAPDSFKGSLTSVAVARALADGWARARPADTVLLCPLADGGEGTLEAVAAAGGWEWQEATVADPLGRQIAGALAPVCGWGARRHRDGRDVGAVAGRSGRARRGACHVVRVGRRPGDRGCVGGA